MRNFDPKFATVDPAATLITLAAGHHIILGTNLKAISCCCCCLLYELATKKKSRQIKSKIHGIFKNRHFEKINNLIPGAICAIKLITNNNGRQYRRIYVKMEFA